MSVLPDELTSHRPAATVLIVDDSDDHRLLARRRLTDAGWDVRVAGSAEEAMSSLDGVDLVLLDYRLPGISGVEVLHQIRRIGGPSVVMVTGMGSENLAVEAMRAGAVDYITKDGTYLEDLPRAVERAWRHHDLQRRAQELQRLALLVTATGDRDRTLADIADGARVVLRADACVLLVEREEGLTPEAMAGDPTLTGVDLRRAARTALSQEVDVEGTTTTAQLLLPVRASDRTALGVLAVITVEPVTYDADELTLARTFAAFAGIALANLRRLELERRLVSELERVLDTRRDFLAHVSHELRTPLTCIQGFTHTLLEHGDAIGAEDERLFLSKISDHSRELHHLVEHLLDYASVEAGSTPVHPVSMDLGSELRSILSGLEPMLDSREIAFDVAPISVTADASLLRRAVTNLVTNAAKYSPTGAPIAIRAVGGMAIARVEVEDEGAGIAPDELSRVFEPFWRGAAVLHGTNRGTGLGLALVREYARLLGGEVGVESTVGKGSRFWFTVPLAAS